ncbi:uncharacterized protein LOC112351340 [Selaginella moellendorffii]|uniref:uncharacterized protein LOC112351340 n=1 Tax=Selaginella moellendorffii TaxID=88036 RepID=UPI000D1C8543|nr:uncharacterized protein LOC112351340 [Selaginella moellendorffii]|eukprot:XP_024544784.1 uncharacterized protein LOC112351340 [Selaginella moellendorffii]
MVERSLSMREAPGSIPGISKSRQLVVAFALLSRSFAFTSRSTPSSPAAEVKVNLLYKKSDRTVPFLEAKKDFVDLLMSFLVLPVGSVIRLLRAGNTVDTGVNSAMVGGAAKLFETIEKMDQSSMEVSKTVLTDPVTDASAFRGGKILTLEGPDSTAPVYKCGRQNCCNFSAGSTHFSCHPDYSHQVLKIGKSPQTTGYVKDNVIFMITDELEVYPTSTIKSIVLLNTLKVKTMEVSVGVNEVNSQFLLFVLPYFPAQGVTGFKDCAQRRLQTLRTAILFYFLE